MGVSLHILWHCTFCYCNFRTCLMNHSHECTSSIFQTTCNVQLLLMGLVLLEPLSNWDIQLPNSFLFSPAGMNFFHRWKGLPDFTSFWWQFFCFPFLCSWVSCLMDSLLYWSNTSTSTLVFSFSNSCSKCMRHVWMSKYWESCLSWITFHSKDWLHKISDD